MRPTRLIVCPAINPNEAPTRNFTGTLLDGETDDSSTFGSYVISHRGTALCFPSSINSNDFAPSFGNDANVDELSVFCRACDRTSETVSSNEPVTFFVSSKYSALTLRYPEWTHKPADPNITNALDAVHRGPLKVRIVWSLKDFTTLNAITSSLSRCFRINRKFGSHSWMGASYRLVFFEIIDPISNSNYMNDILYLH